MVRKTIALYNFNTGVNPVKSNASGFKTLDETKAIADANTNMIYNKDFIVVSIVYEDSISESNAEFTSGTNAVFYRVDFASNVVKRNILCNVETLKKCF